MNELGRHHSHDLEGCDSPTGNNAMFRAKRERRREMMIRQ